MPWEQITKHNIADEHNKLVEAVYAYDYFVTTFERAKASFELDPTVPEQVCSFWNHFWYMLPDHSSIRRQPFERVCDMAEGEYI